jgi:hypothetical protein
MMSYINGATAQASDSKKEKIDALRAAFISKKINLTNDEALKFWPLYNEMNDRLDANRKTFRLQYNANTNYNFATDKDAEIYLAAELNLKQKEFELYKEYYDKFKKVLPVKKVAALRRAEDDFKKEIIKTIKEN